MKKLSTYILLAICAGGLSAHAQTVIADFTEDFVKSSAGPGLAYTGTETLNTGWSYLYTTNGIGSSNYLDMVPSTTITPETWITPGGDPANMTVSYGSGTWQAGTGEDLRVIAAYEIQTGEAGTIALVNSVLNNLFVPAALDMLVYVNDRFVRRVEVRGVTTTDFDCPLGNLVAGDVVYVIMDGLGGALGDKTSIDYQLVKDDTQLLYFSSVSATNAYYTEPVTFDWGIAPDADSLTVSPAIDGTTDLLALTTNEVGTIDVTVTSNTSYTITLTRGVETTNLVYDVTFNAMSIDSFIAFPAFGYEDDEVVLSWDVPGAESIVISNETAEIVATNIASGSFALIQPVGTDTYTLTASNSGSELLSDSAEVVIQTGTAPTPWIAVSPWTGDADSGIDGTLTYTAAYNFGNLAEDTTINAVHFTGVAGGSQDIPDVFSLNHVNAVADTSRNIVGGGSGTMAVRMVFGKQNAVLQLRGLTPFQTYRTTIFGVAWENGTREANFGIAGSGISQVVDEDMYGNNNGVKIEIEFEAKGTTQDINIDAFVAGTTFHMYGFANAETAGISAEPLLEYLFVGATNVSVGSSSAFDWAVAGDADSMTVSPAIGGVTELLALSTNGIGSINATIESSETYTFTVTRGSETTNVVYEITALVPQGTVVQPVGMVSSAASFTGRPPEDTYNGDGLALPSSVETGESYSSAWTPHGTAATTMFMTATGAGITPTLTWDLGQSYTLHGFHLWNYNEDTAGNMDRGIRTANLSYSTDGTNYTSTAITSSEFAMANGGSDEGQTYEFTGNIDARYVRFEVQSNWGDPGYTGVAEVRFTAPFVATSAHLSINNDAGQLSVTAINMAFGASNILQGTVSLNPAKWVDLGSSIFDEKTWILVESETNRFFRVESN